MTGWALLSRLGLDLKWAVRGLSKRGGYVAVAVLTIAVGVGASTAIFSVVDTVMLRPLPYVDQDELVDLWNFIPDQDLFYGGHSLDTMQSWRDQTQLFDSVEAYRTQSFVLEGGEEPERIQGAFVTVGLLPTLGVEPLLGRVFSPEEAEAGGGEVALISEGLWRHRFGSDPQIAGQLLTLSDQSYTIVGVLPAEIRFPYSATRVWMPVTERPEAASEGMRFELIGRLHDGGRLVSAQREVDRIATLLAEEQPRDSGWNVKLTLYEQRRVSGRSRSTLWVLLAGVGLLLLIACANIANLSLAVATARQQEMAVRSALGASRLRVARHLLAENLLLGLGGGALGVLFAAWGIPAVVGLAPEQLTFMVGNTFRVDGRVLAFAVLISILTGVLTALAPALRSFDLEHLSGGGRWSTASRGQHRTRGALVVLQLSLSLVLLTGAGLMGRSFARLMSVDLGFRAENLLAVGLDLDEARYSEGPVRRDFYERLIAGIRALPGVEAVTLANGLPPRGGGITFGISPQAEGHARPPTDRSLILPSAVVADDYFRVMGIELLEGRSFTDEKAASRSIIINEPMARYYWQGSSPVGGRFRLDSDSEWHTVVGVVADVRAFGAVEPFGPMEMYYPITRDGSGSGYRTLAIRASGDPMDLVPLVKQVVWQIDPRQPIGDINLMVQLLADSLARPRFLLTLVGVFSVVALVLAAVGLYGVISYSVSQRTQEIGLRMVLGAERGAVVRLVLAQGLRFLLFGTLLGLAAALWLTRFVETLIYQIDPMDPITYLGVVVLLGAVALLASYAPARRASRVEPSAALRAD